LTKTTVSGPGGVYVIYNVQPGDYSVKAYSSGYYQANDSLYRTVKADSALRNVNVSLVSGYKSNKFN